MVSRTVCMTVSGPLLGVFGHIESRSHFCKRTYLQQLAGNSYNFYGEPFTVMGLFDSLMLLILSIIFL